MLVREAIAKIDKAAANGVMHKNKAARKKASSPSVSTPAHRAEHSRLAETASRYRRLLRLANRATSTSTTNSGGQSLVRNDRSASARRSIARPSFSLPRRRLCCIAFFAGNVLPFIRQRRSGLVVANIGTVEAQHVAVALVEHGEQPEGCAILDPRANRRTGSAAATERAPPQHKHLSIASSAHGTVGPWLPPKVVMSSAVTAATTERKVRMNFLRPRQEVLDRRFAPRSSSASSPRADRATVAPLAFGAEVWRTSAPASWPPP